MMVFHPQNLSNISLKPQEDPPNAVLYSSDIELEHGLRWLGQ
jgi:hypothetical protein